MKGSSLAQAKINLLIESNWVAAQTANSQQAWSVKNIFFMVGKAFIWPHGLSTILGRELKSIIIIIIIVMEEFMMMIITTWGKACTPQVVHWSNLILATNNYSWLLLSFIFVLMLGNGGSLFWWKDVLYHHETPYYLTYLFAIFLRYKRLWTWGLYQSLFLLRFFQKRIWK